MKKYIKKTITKQYDVVDKTICDCCNKEIQEFKEYVNIQKTFGYFAEIFQDGDRYDIDICEDCFEKWILSFHKIP